MIKTVIIYLKKTLIETNNNNNNLTNIDRR